MDVFIYGQNRRRECADMSLHGMDITAAAEKGDDQRGRLLGAAYLDADAYIQVHENVVIEGEIVHREKYAYYLVADDEEIGGYERDPHHDPAEHFHCGEHEPGGTPHPAVSFKEAVRKAWAWRSLHPPDPTP